MSDELRKRLGEIAPVAPAGDMAVMAAQLFDIKVGQLKAVCLKNPNHPLSDVKLKSIAGMSDDAQVTIEALDLEAILDNKDTFMEESITEDGRRLLCKRLGDSLSTPKKSVAKPVDPPKPPVNL